jgi:hypothetical protein
MLLNKSIYGIVQSAREFYKGLLESAGRTDNKSAAFSLSKWDEEGAILIGIYVEDNHATGSGI